MPNDQKFHKIHSFERLLVSSFCDYIKRYEETETVLTPYEIRKKQSKDNKIPTSKLLDDEELKDFITTKCLEDPTTSLSKYSGDVLNEFGIVLAKSTVDRYFANEGWKWKRISRIAIEVDLDEEYAFREKLMNEVEINNRKL